MSRAAMQIALDALDSWVIKGSYSGPDLTLFPDAMSTLRVALSQSIDGVAWQHTLIMECDQRRVVLTTGKETPYGKPGKDYSAEYSVISEPLYTRP